MEFAKRALVMILTLLLSVAAARATERWQTLPQAPAMPQPVTSGTAPVNGIAMYYAVYGAGPPVLLIHGGLAYADLWANQVIDLSKDHMVIVADSRGHGRSTRTPAPYGYDLMASDYLALLDHLKLDKVALVGWSDGGIIGLDIAMKHPARLTKLFALAANTKTSGVKSDTMQNPTFARFVTEAGAAYRRLSPTPDQYDAFVAQIGHMWESQPSWSDADLQKITVPTAIVLGDHDEAIDRGHTEYMARIIPGAKLIILKDASHFAMLQDPEGFNTAVRAFLAE